jgi:hypothetical protein
VAAHVSPLAADERERARNAGFDVPDAMPSPFDRVLRLPAVFRVGRGHDFGPPTDRRPERNVHSAAASDGSQACGHDFRPATPHWVNRGHDFGPASAIGQTRGHDFGAAEGHRPGPSP